MAKGTALLGVLTLLFCVVLADNCTYTTTNFLSPHSLGKQDEITDALAILCKQVRPNLTHYEYGKTNYTLYNFSVRCIYNDGKQVADITSGDHVSVTGGKIEFAVNFNYSVSKIGPDKLGWAYASAFTDVISFVKEITIDDQGHPTWILTLNMTPKVEMSSQLAASRFDPKPTDDDVLAINQALSTAITAITPKNLKQQILDLLNENYTAILNQTLKEKKVFTDTINYSFPHPFKGALNVTVLNRHYTHEISQEEGFELFYLTYVEGFNTTDCKYVLPNTHKNYSMYGGIQSFIGLDFARQLARYSIQKRWLDTLLDGTAWETSAFQFYAGDLYDVIAETQKLAPRTKVSGGCNALEDSFFDLRRYNYESLQLTVNYSCILETSDVGRIRLAEFHLPVRFELKLTLEYEQLEVVINSALAAGPSFAPVGNYYVTDPNLAVFKINMGLRSLLKYRVFGSGFPTWPRDFPEIEVDTSGAYMFLHDKSQIPHSSTQ